MAATHFQDDRTESSDDVRLRVGVYDALAAAKGYRTVESQAAWHGLARSSMFRLRGGDTPRLDTAMRIAADLGVAVEVIWERVAA